MAPSRLHPLLDEIARGVAHAAREETPFRTPCVIQEDHGFGKRVLDVTATALPGAPRRILVTARDVTALVASSNAPACTHACCTALIEEAPLGVCIVTLEGDYIAQNRAHAQVYGYTDPEEMRAHVSNARDVFVHPEDRDRLMTLLQRDGVVTNFEALVRRKGGGHVWTSRTLRAIPAPHTTGADGDSVTQYMTFVEDIQARKEAEQASLEAHAQLLTVLEQLTAGVYVLEPEECVILYANNALQANHDAPLEGRNASEALLAERGNCPFTVTNGNLRELGDTHTCELRFKDGTWRLCTAKRIHWLHNGPAVLVVATDITDIKHAEQIKADMDRIMRHDLKAPLHGVITLPELLAASRSFSPEEKQMLGAIRDSGRKMLRLVDTSLSLYKLETGCYEIQWGKLNLLKELNIALNELAGLLRAKSLQLYARTEHGPGLDPTASSLLGDLTLLPFLLSNLLKNAAEASPMHGAIFMEMRFDELFRLTIRNTGAVPLVMRPRFFEKYATHGKSNGSGLGAYSARLIARAHGGDVAMSTSDSTNATTLTVTLPQTYPFQLPRNHDGVRRSRCGSGDDATAWGATPSKP